MAATVDERLAQAFVELADTLVAGYDLMEFLQTLTDRCVELLDVDAAGLLLADSGGLLRLVAASTERARVVELFQIQNDEGPCLDCFHTGQPVIVSDIRAHRAASRWPQFAAAAEEMSYVGVHAIPMRLRDQVIGTLNLFRTAPDGLTPAVVVAATALADVATIGILQERAVRQQEVVAGQLQVALNSRVMIEQAKGVLAERLRLTPDEAFVVLRRYARDHNHPLTELSGDVIRGTARITMKLGGPPWIVGQTGSGADQGERRGGHSPRSGTKRRQDSGAQRDRGSTAAHCAVLDPRSPVDTLWGYKWWFINARTMQPRPRPGRLLATALIPPGNLRPGPSACSRA